MLVVSERDLDGRERCPSRLGFVECDVNSLGGLAVTSCLDQRSHIAALFEARVVEHARERGIERLYGAVLPEGRNAERSGMEQPLESRLGTGSGDRGTLAIRAR